MRFRNFDNEKLSKKKYFSFKFCLAKQFVSDINSAATDVVTVVVADRIFMMIIVQKT